MHHRKKRSHLTKGTHWDDVTNIGALCGSGVTGCHGYVEANPKIAESEGWHCRPWQDPAEIPVLYRGQWARLTADGKVDLERESRGPVVEGSPPGEAG